MDGKQEGKVEAWEREWGTGRERQARGRSNGGIPRKSGYGPPDTNERSQCAHKDCQTLMACHPDYELCSL